MNEKITKQELRTEQSTNSYVDRMDKEILVYS